MTISFIITIIASLAVAAFFARLQLKYFNETNKNRTRYQKFFNRDDDFTTTVYDNREGKEISLISEGNLPSGSDLRQLIKEINTYVLKNVGTTDFSVIQNKTERKLSMLYEEAMSRVAFPTYLGLMGTFAGVFMGVFMFLIGFDKTGVTDEAIKNLLCGVLVSMSTSFFGLFLTTKNNKNATVAKKKVDEDKNEFYDFVQNELMPTLDVSMVAALNKLRDTVNLFEPSFNEVIGRFQTTFDTCTAAFGEEFKRNVEVVVKAVATMGANMDKVNDNVIHQNELLNTLKAKGMMRTLDKFVESADKFQEITSSLNDFERARRMMLEASKRVIEYQQQYNDSLQIPLEVAARLNDILNRITRFENSINELGTSIKQTQLIGNDTIELIRDQINAINKKGKLAAKYIDKADDRLENLFAEQVKMIDKMNDNYRAALDRHIAQYGEQIEFFAKEMMERRQNFLDAIGQRISLEDVQQDFSNLNKLNDIDKKLKELEDKVVSARSLQDSINAINKLLSEMKETLNKMKDQKSNSKDEGKSESKSRWPFNLGNR